MMVATAVICLIILIAAVIYLSGEVKIHREHITPPPPHPRPMVDEYFMTDQRAAHLATERYLTLDEAVSALARGEGSHPVYQGVEFDALRNKYVHAFEVIDPAPYKTVPNYPPDRIVFDA